MKAHFAVSCLKKCKDKIPMADTHRRNIITPQTKASPETPIAATRDPPFLFSPGFVGFGDFWTRMGSSLKEAFPHAWVNAGSFMSAKRLRSYNTPVYEPSKAP